MSGKLVRSRILENFSESLLTEMYGVYKNVKISDNNTKSKAMLALLDKHKVQYFHLGKGTNRLAVLIDNYVYKIALDRWGLRDNINEFAMSQELQPYVVKTYETNELLSVCEYVTLISDQEFMAKKEQIREVLAVLYESYLLGDVGTIKKNYCNWGYRDNNELVILDYAYIYRITGEELYCQHCGHIIEYDENFHNLICPKCNKKYSFMDIRRKIPLEVEDKENYMAKQLSYQLTQSKQFFKEDEDEEENSSLFINEKCEEEDNAMKDLKDYENEYEEVDDEEAYMNALEEFQNDANRKTDTEIENTSDKCEEHSDEINEKEENDCNEPDTVVKAHVEVFADKEKLFEQNVVITEHQDFNIEKEFGCSGEVDKDPNTKSSMTIKIPDGYQAIPSQTGCGNEQGKSSLTVHMPDPNKCGAGKIENCSDENIGQDNKEETPEERALREEIEGDQEYEKIYDNIANQRQQEKYNNKNRQQ